ncbi:MAG TPA: hypothetical protein VHP31_12150 [Caproicibacter sp.]|nr:hypothetical protein [Caproicibacter sp.]
MSELKPANFSYPHIKADLALCENQLDALCNARPVEEASMHIPAVETDFDMQFQAAFDELKAYRNTKLTPEQIESHAAPENKSNVSEISVAKAIKRMEDLIGILDIRIGWGDGPADILSEKRDYELAIAALRNYVPKSGNNPLTLEQLRQMDGDTEDREWVWIELIVPLKSTDSAYFQVQHDYTHGRGFCCGYPGTTWEFDYSDYGKTWLAYVRKPVSK